MSALIISFEGRDADDGRLEAYSGIESAAGIARSLTLIAHYAATGQVRQRFPFDDTAQFYLVSTEQGSFRWRLVLNIVGSLALGMTGNGLYDLSKLVMAKAIGEEPTHLSQEIKQINERKSGDIDALVEAIEPALKKGHYGIGETADRIIIKEETSHEVIVSFDDASKRYLLGSIEADIDAQDVSISALNANDRTGRAYFLDLGRTIPFRVSRDADGGTMATLSASLDSYVNRHSAPLRLRFRRIEAVDGRLKRIIVYGAEDVTTAD